MPTNIEIKDTFTACSVNTLDHLVLILFGKHTLVFAFATLMFECQHIVAPILIIGNKPSYCCQNS